jgi:hypothetical protein
MFDEGDYRWITWRVPAIDATFGFDSTVNFPVEKSTILQCYLRVIT